MAVPGELAEAAGPCEVVLGCGWSSSPLLLSCRSVFVFCRNVRETAFLLQTVTINIAFCDALAPSPAFHFPASAVSMAQSKDVDEGEK